MWVERNKNGVQFGHNSVVLGRIVRARSIIQNTMPPTTNDAAITPACDCHFHVFDAHQAAPGARYVPSYSATLDDWEAHAQRSGVSRGVLVQPSFLGTDLRRLLAALRARPLMLRGVAVVSANAKSTELQALHALGVRGVRLNLMGAANDVDALRALPATWWSAVLQAGLHVELHADVGRMASLLPWVPTDACVVLDHFAKPERVDANDATVRAVRERTQAGAATYVTLSGAYRQSAGTQLHSAALAALLLAELGASQLLWASDWPCTNFEREADYVRLLNVLGDWLPNADDHRAALGANAKRLYWR